MKIKYVFTLLFILSSLTSFGQNKDIRIGPGPGPQQPGPVIIYDGIPYVSSKIWGENPELIESISIQKDSVFDCKGVLTNVGTVMIFTKDSINLGAKKILSLTNNWLYTHPHTRLMINKEIVDWDETTYHKLISLKPEDIVYAKVIRRKKNQCEMILKIKIKE